jgi:hypothetical protein
MATDIENLQTRRSAVCAELAALTTSSAGGKPNNPSGVDHTGYKASLYAELEAIDKLIAALTAEEAVDDGPFEYFAPGIP